MSQAESRVAGYLFDSFYIDAANRQLWRAGTLISLNSKYFDVLLLLASHGGQLVEKSRIFEEIWAGVFVTDAALTQCIKDIRRQLGDDASNPRYIRTIPKHGYIFIGNVIPAHRDESIGGSPGPLPLAAEPSANQTGDLMRPPARPYKFLDYYTEQDARLFFGREFEVESICSQILAHRSFILHGRSGVGKSSIIRAGLMPHLKSDNHQVFVIRSFTDPLQQMTSALARLTDLDAAGEATLTELVSAAETIWPARLVIFFLDQFEEFFSLLPEDPRRKFLDTIASLI